MAANRLPRMLHGFIESGSERGASMNENAESFRSVVFKTSVLTGRADRTQETEIFGKTYAAPFGVAPMGAAALCAYDADIAIADAAEHANIPMIVSGSSLIPIERIARTTSRVWYQGYLSGDESVVPPLLDRLVAANVDTFVLTVDCPVPANREANLRNGFDIPVRPSLRLAAQAAMRPRWLLSTMLKTLITHGDFRFHNLQAGRGASIFARVPPGEARRRDRLSWKHLALLRKQWRGNLVVKGILSASDARQAVEAGADAIYISNHGGRQLDSAIAPLGVLQDIRNAIGQKPIFMDGAVRRGTDVLKALALGADFVFVGRPFLHAVSFGGESAVAHAIQLLKEEVDRDMALLGLETFSDLDPCRLAPSFFSRTLMQRP